MNIYVLRHGQTNLNIQNKFQGRVDTELNETGIKQVQESKSELEKINFDFVFVSPLKRAIATAKIVTNNKLIIDERIIERSFGSLEGKLGIPDYEEKKELYGIESIEEMKIRIYNFLDELRDKYSKMNNILIVTHEAVAQVINSYFCNIDDIKSFRLKTGSFIKYQIFDKEQLMKKLEEKELNRIFDKNISQNLIKSNENNDKLKIVYLMVWTKVCGGSKIILEYVNRLANRGHKISIISYDEYPKWFNLNSYINFIQVPENEEIEDYIPPCDLIVSTSWKNIFQAINSNKAPVTFFEQGGSHIFDVENLSKEKQDAVKTRFDMLDFIYTVSSYTKNQIKKYYNKDSEVVCNAINTDVFYYDSNIKKDDGKINITIIGSEKFKFKNIDESLEVIRRIKENYNNIVLNWISQDKPERNPEKAIVNPKQEDIADTLRKTDIFICNSEYESFCLPALEAMSCGACVITTDNGGIRDFVIDGKNALIINKHDANDMFNKIECLINDSNLRKKMQNEGLITSKKFSWDESTNKLENYYKEIAKYKIQ